MFYGSSSFDEFRDLRRLYPYALRLANADVEFVNRVWSLFNDKYENTVEKDWVVYEDLGKDAIKKAKGMGLISRVNDEEYEVNIGM